MLTPQFHQRNYSRLIDRSISFMKIEQRDLEYFAIVAEHGNLGRAAEALGLSQPALSASLRRLEGLTGSKIVRRTPKGVDLTDTGAALLKHVGRMRLAHDDILREVSDIGQARSGHVRVGASMGLSDARLTVACSKLLNDAPRVTVSVTGANQPDLLSLLRSGTVDFLFTSGIGLDAEDLSQEHVTNDQYIVCCSSGHRLVRARRVTMADLVGERWVLPGERNSASQRRLQFAFEERGLPPPKVALTSALSELRLGIVAATNLLGHNALGVVQDASERLRLKVLRIDDWQPVPRPAAVIYRKDAYLSPAARRLIDLVKATVKTAQ